MTAEEKDEFLRRIKQLVQFTEYGNEWYLDIQASDFDFRHECRSLEEYKKESFNYYMNKLLADKEL